MRELLPFKGLAKEVVEHMGLGSGIQSTVHGNTVVHKDNNGALILANSPAGRSTKDCEGSVGSATGGYLNKGIETPEICRNEKEIVRLDCQHRAVRREQCHKTRKLRKASSRGSVEVEFRT